ncbi:PAS domain S-box protein [Chloroflexota bacterium]
MKKVKQREHNQEELQENLVNIESYKQRLAALSAISGFINQPLEVRELLELGSDKILELMDADSILVFLLDEEKGELLLELYQGVSDDFVSRARRVRIGEGFNGTVVQTGEPLVIDESATSPLLSRQEVVIEGIRSQLIVPLKSKGKAIGTLCVARHIPRRFHTYEVELLRSIGNQIGAALENARLYQDMKRTLKQLKQSEERYRDLFENASDAIWLHDLEGNTLAANMACEKITGYSAEELHHLPVDRLLDDCSKSCINDIEERLLCNQPVDHRCEVDLTKKGGEKALVQITTSLMVHDGKAVGFEHVARDVTDQRRMEENLRYYLQQATRAQEEERKRIARELHDETLQNLIVISRQMEKITSSEALWEESLEVVRGLKKQIEVAVQEMRRFSHNLRPSVLDDLGLLPALELLVDDIEKEGINTSFKVIGGMRRLSPEVEVMLFRIAQEAVRNISRHAQASEAELAIEFNDSRLRMSIKDNGIGLELLQSIGEQASLGKLGLVGMRERARLLGGTMTVDSTSGKGTTIAVEVHI